jgi:hypothetical protein
LWIGGQKKRHPREKIEDLEARLLGLLDHIVIFFTSMESGAKIDIT